MLLIHFLAFTQVFASRSIIFLVQVEVTNLVKGLKELKTVCCLYFCMCFNGFEEVRYSLGIFLLHFVAFAKNGVNIKKKYFFFRFLSLD